MPSSSDPIWGIIGVIATVVLGIATIAIAVFIYRRQSRKSLSYSILTLEPILTVRDIAEEKVKVLYDGVPVKNITLAVIKVVNNGNVPIPAGDYERPLSFNAGPGTEIVSAEVVEKKPSSLTPIIAIGHKDRRSAVTLTPLLLNGGDNITIKCLIKEAQNEIEPDARIAGIKKIVQISPASEVGFREFIKIVFLPSPGSLTAVLIFILLAIAVNIASSYLVDVVKTLFGK